MKDVIFLTVEQAELIRDSDIPLEYLSKDKRHKHFSMEFCRTVEQQSEAMRMEDNPLAEAGLYDPMAGTRVLTMTDETRNGLSRILRTSKWKVYCPTTELMIITPCTKETDQIITNSMSQHNCREIVKAMAIAGLPIQDIVATKPFLKAA